MKDVSGVNPVCYSSIVPGEICPVQSPPAQTNCTATLPAHLAHFSSESHETHQAGHVGLGTGQQFFVDILGYSVDEPIQIRLIPPKKTPIEVLVRQGMTFKNKKGKDVPSVQDYQLVLGFGGGATLTRWVNEKDKDGNKTGNKILSKHTYSDGWGQLQKLNRKGYGIYHVVNPGGRSDSDITEARVIFAELDLARDDYASEADHAVAVQAAVQAAIDDGYAVVQTDKGPHFYRQLSQPVTDLAQWSKTQQRFIQGNNADPANFNPARLMRSPGFLHWRWDGEKLVSKAIALVSLGDGQSISLETLEATLPAWDSEQWTEDPTAPTEKRKGKVKASGGVYSLDPGEAGPWSMLNLVQYLDHATSGVGAAIAHAQCPLHTQDGGTHSTDHIHVMSGGGFAVHCGCTKKAVYAEARRRAIAAGYSPAPAKAGAEAVAEAKAGAGGEETIPEGIGLDELHLYPPALDESDRQATLDRQEAESEREYIKRNFDRAAWKYYQTFGVIPEAPRPSKRGQRRDIPANRALALYVPCVGIDGVIDLCSRALRPDDNHNRLVLSQIDDIPSSFEAWVELGRPQLIIQHETPAIFCLEIEERLGADVARLVSQWNDGTGGGKTHHAGEFIALRTEGEKVKREIQRGYKEALITPIEVRLYVQEERIKHIQGLVERYKERTHEDREHFKSLVADLQAQKSDNRSLLKDINEQLRALVFTDDDGNYLHGTERKQRIADRAKVKELKAAKKEDGQSLEAGLKYDIQVVLERLQRIQTEYNLAKKLLAFAKNQRKVIEGQLERAEAEFQRLAPSVSKTILFDSDSRNAKTATTEVIEEAVTGAGLMLVEGHRTPSGAPYRRRAKFGQKPDIEPDCHHEDQFQAISANGVEVTRGVKSAFCGGCTEYRKEEERENCPMLVKQAAQRQVLQLRSHPSKGGTGRVAQRKTIESAIGTAVVDEPSHSLNNHFSLSVTTDDIDREISTIATYAPAAWYAYSPVAIQIKKGLDRAISECGFHGISHHDLLQYMPDPAAVRERVFDAFCYELPNVNPDKKKRDAKPFLNWFDCDDVWDCEDLANVPMRHLRKTQEVKELVKGSDEQRWQKIEQINKGAIARTIAILLGKRGDMVVKFKGADKENKPTYQVSFKYRSNVHKTTLKNFKHVHLLDATGDPKDLAVEVGCKAADIVPIRWASPRFCNMTLKVYRGLDRVGAQRDRLERKGGQKTDVISPYAKGTRVNKAARAVMESLPDAKWGVLDTKAEVATGYADLKLNHEPIMGWHHCHNLGTNIFSGVTDLLMVGANAVPNVGECLADWHLRTGEVATLRDDAPAHHKPSGAFWQWVNKKGTDHLVQSGGRPRAQHRPQQQITLHHVGDLSAEDIKAMRRHYPGIVVAFIDIQTICPEAAQKGDQTTRLVLQAMMNQIKAGQNPKQSQIAKEVERSNSTVSRVCAEDLGLDFRSLRKSLVLLLEAINSKTELIELDEKTKEIALEHLPEIAARLTTEPPILAVADFVQIFEKQGAATFKAILAEASPTVIGALTAACLAIAPPPDISRCRTERPLAALEVA
jgi:hypothetical protein